MFLICICMQAVQELSLPCQARMLALLLRELVPAQPNLRRLNQLFAADPVLALELLHSANAAPYQMAGQVRGIPQAVTLLGARHLNTLLKKAQATTAQRSLGEVDMAQFARLSTQAAKLARSLAGLVRLDACAAYSAGLLHGVGQLVVQQTQPQAIAQLPKDVPWWDPRRPRVELRQWGYSASKVTGTLLQECALPYEVSAAILAMDAPLQSEHFDPLAGVLHVAVWCCRARESAWSERLMADAFPMEVALALGLDMDVVLQQDAADWSRSIY